MLNEGTRVQMGDGPITVLETRADQIFRDITPQMQ